MNIEDIKGRVANFKEEWAGATGMFDREDFSDDVIYLLSIIEQAEKALEDIACHSLYPAGVARIALERIRGN